MLRILDGEVVILGAARTPVGAYDGCLKDFRAPDLGGFALKAAIERSGLAPADLDEVFMGNAVAGGLGQNPTKQAAFAAGVPMTTPTTAVNVVCASGLGAIFEGIRAILARTGDIVAAGGMESRTNAAYLLGPKDKRGARIPGQARGDVFIPETPPPDAEVGEYRKVIRSFRAAGIKEPNTFETLVCWKKPATSMKDYAVTYGKSRGWTVEFVDEAAAESFRRAEQARDEGVFAEEIVPAGEVKDDEIATRELQATLREKSDSFCSAYNAPSLADGAAAVILAARERAESSGLQPLARVTAFARVDTPPEDFIEAPIAATKLITDGLREAGREASFDLIEANESFGVQIPAFKEKIPIERQNPHGGAVALRQPLGAVGPRILTTLLYALARHDLGRGIATTCFGSGGALAIAVERI